MAMKSRRFGMFLLLFSILVLCYLVFVWTSQITTRTHSNCKKAVNAYQFKEVNGNTLKELDKTCRKDGINLNDNRLNFDYWKRNLTTFSCPQSREYLSFPKPLVALASFPGSGNTWTRGLIETVTGIHTGSICKDWNFVGSKQCPTRGKVFMIKTHRRMEMDEDNSNYEDYDDDYEYDFIRMTPPFQIVSAISLGILILFAISGNTITIIAYITDKRLHTVYDFFIFNLAVTDLSIGCISMPFYAIYTLKEFVWDFGDTVCKVWNVVDFTLCLESILLILMLSFDRLCLVKYGPFYSSKVTKFKARLVVFISWIISFMLYGPAIIGWNYWVGYTTVEPLDCDVEFAYNFAFTTTAGIIEFVIPVSGLAILNVFIYQHIRSRLGHENKSKLNNGHPSTVIRAESSLVREVDISATRAVNNRATHSLDLISSHDQNDKPREDSNENVVNEMRKKSDYIHNITSEAQGEKGPKVSDYKLHFHSSQVKHKEVRIFVDKSETQDTIDRSNQTHDKVNHEDITDHMKQEGSDNLERKLNGVNMNTETCTHSLEIGEPTVNRTHNRIKFATIPERRSVFNISVNVSENTRRKSRNKHEHSRIKRDSKAARFLAILVIVFLACWAPYTVTTIVVSFCGGECVNTSAYECMNWLLWSKSAINPFLYAMNSSRYRYNFKKYIICWKNQVYPSDTETTCQTAG